ncbi:ABC transporter permease [Prosthecochloris vibrioformis]|uniref:ABC transporter permease n=1 Tax=Prosthecochloris vibrioformis TaxID=1098 RepID=A0A5C4S148_PROVB|nr:ABC transporter permease [Prosthecochloris vibrioformis]TNJ37226.1 ABC transporter permease [Prosthecochloris vibrioformis]
MTIIDELRIAWVHLRERKRQSILTALGVGVGSAMLITTMALASGSSRNVVSRIIDISPHVILTSERLEPLVPENLIGKKQGMVSMVEKNITTEEKDTIKRYADVVASVSADPEVEVVSPFVQTKLILRNRSRFTPCIAKGIEPAREGGIASLKNKLLEPGALDELDYTPDGIILGSLLAEKMNASHRSRLVLISQNGNEYPVVVVGRFSTGFNARDEQEAYINLSLAQRIEGLQATAVSGIGMKTSRVDRASAVARRLESATGYRAESWDETNRNVIDFYNRNNNITLVLVGFVFIVAGLGVSSVMTTVVLQKTKDIAIMRSMGVQRGSITRIFMIEGFLIGLLGVAFGSPLGHFICRIVASIRYAANTAGVIQTDRLNVFETPESHILVIVFGIVVTILSSYGPAKRASGFLPVRILRGQVN